jgi:hypothetical protein
MSWLEKEMEEKENDPVGAAGKPWLVWKPTTDDPSVKPWMTWNVNVDNGEVDVSKNVVRVTHVMGVFSR